MKIGIDGSRAFLKQRTGIEEYSYQVIKHLRDKLVEQEVFLYLRKNQEVDFELPKNWRIKIVKWPYLWTQVGLSLEMFLHPVDILFVPAHTVPFIHPENTVVTIHGLEYELVPEAYSFWARLYMRLVIRNSCRWAKKIISVSENTKKDLVRLYDIAENKIQVIYEGYDTGVNFQFPISNFQIKFKSKISNSKYLLFIGRLEERKNIIGIIKAFEVLKERYKISHKLVLAGKFGHGAEKIQVEIENSNFIENIILPGFVPDEDKFALIKGADVFLFPTFYEGFGIPILEAQSMGVPVITSNLSSMPEVAGDSAILIDPMKAEQIADETHKLLSDQKWREEIIRKGHLNVAKFSWEECAREISRIL